jgi:hypothetical protein
LVEFREHIDWGSYSVALYFFCPLYCLKVLCCMTLGSLVTL